MVIFSKRKKGKPVRKGFCFLTGRVEGLSNGVTLRTDQKRWDQRFGRKGFALGREPNPFLKKHLSRLPKGRALDLATGEGRNAVFLAQRGFQVDAVDISGLGLRKAKKLAKQAGVTIHTIQADLDSYRIPEGTYDLIANLYFLKRNLIPRIKRGLKKGGRVIFETYILEHRSLATEGPKQSKYFLGSNELLRIFDGFRILFYREGIFREGGKRKAVASLIAEKTH